MKLSLRIKNILPFILLSLSYLHPISASAFCHFYVGLGAGPESANFKQKALVIGRVTETFSAIDRTHFAGKGVFGSLFFGAETRFSGCNPCLDNFYLALEANANLRTTKFKFTNDEYVNLTFNHSIYQLRRDFGLSILPGYAFTECTLFYARLGYSNVKFVVDTTDISLQNITQKLDGFRYGLGFRQGLCNCWSFRIEYSQVDYRNAKMFTFDRVGNVTKYTAISPHTQRFEIGLLYSF